MIWSHSSVLHRLFSHKVTVAFFVFLGMLLIFSSYLSLNIRESKRMSIQDIRLASWNLTQFRTEAEMFDKYLMLAGSEIANPALLTLSYEILWSRFSYLLNSAEIAALRSLNSNTVRITDINSQFKQLSQPIFDMANNSPNASTLESAREVWANIYMDINQLVIENLVGGDSDIILDQFDTDLDKFRFIKKLTIILSFGGFLYIIFMFNFLRKQLLLDPLTRTFNLNYLNNKAIIKESDSYIVIRINNSQHILKKYSGGDIDTLIQLCAKRITEHIYEEDLLIHVSYGEFVILKKHSSSNINEAVLVDLIKKLQFDWSIGSATIPIQFVAGMDPAIHEGKAIQHWRERHDRALKALSYAIDEGFIFYASNDELIDAFDIEKNILRELVQLLRHNTGELKLWLVYQPIMAAMFSTQVAGAEVLLRGRLNDVIIPPNEIVDICEHHGLGKELGVWILRKAALESEYLFSEMNFDGFLSINLNPSLICEQLPEILTTHLLSKHIPARQVCLEITEDNAAIDFERTLPIIQKVRNMGIKFALDDFGTGHSSLAYLQRLKIDKLKIDRCFVTDIETDASKNQFLAEIIGMTKRMDVETIVEGIENREQGLLAMQHGADYVQGFCYYRPLEMGFFTYLMMIEQGHEKSIQELTTG